MWLPFLLVSWEAAEWWMEVTKIGEAANPGPLAGFQPSAEFSGFRPGQVFKTGCLGTGYYADGPREVIDLQAALRTTAEDQPRQLVLDDLVRPSQLVQANLVEAPLIPWVPTSWLSGVDSGSAEVEMKNIVEQMSTYPGPGVQLTGLEPRPIPPDPVQRTGDVESEPGEHKRRRKRRKDGGTFISFNGSCWPTARAFLQRTEAKVVMAQELKLRNQTRLEAETWCKRARLETFHRRL